MVYRTLSFGSELCKHANNFWRVVVSGCGTAHGGKPTSKVTRFLPKNGPKSADDQVGSAKLASSDEKFYLMFRIALAREFTLEN